MRNQSIEKAQRIILFDGVCNLCNGFVQFIVKRDPKGQFKFAALESEIGKSLLETYEISPQIDSIVFIEDNKAFIHSDAPLKISRQLSGFWPILYYFIYFPKPLRDLTYKWVAKYRYRFFGKKDSCMIPTPELKNRFLA